MEGHAWVARIAGLRQAFRSGRTRDRRWREQRLKALRTAITAHEAEWLEALRQDLGKGATEGWATEVNFVTAEIDHALLHLDLWMEDEEVATPLHLQPASSWVRRDPLGVVLIIGPWNYPVNLILGPLVAALAAGNLVVLKPSELAPATSALVAKRIGEAFAPDEVLVIEGGVDVSEALLAEPWDLIFFTGSPRVGRLVARAAAEHLTPVVLELGGKSPCWVDGSAPRKATARRILFGKCTNAGQTCVAPDYVLVTAGHRDALVESLKEALAGFYGPDPRQSADYGRIVSERHVLRLAGLLDGQQVVHGGGHDAEARYFEPTIVLDPDPASPLMQEEIFGPILPILTVGSVDEAAAFIASRPHPLALYAFSRRKKEVARLLAGTRSGGVCVNGTVLHMASAELPFGGVGMSGTGAYHGRYGFEAFTHRRAVMDRMTLVDPPVLYPPYVGWKQRALRVLL